MTTLRPLLLPATAVAQVVVYHQAVRFTRTTFCVWRTLMATGSADGTICVWNFDSGKLVTKLLAYEQEQQEVESKSESDSERSAAGGGGAAAPTLPERAVEQLVWLKTKNGAAIATAVTGAAAIGGATSPLPLPSPVPSSNAAPLTTSTPRGLLVSCSSDGYVRFWDVSRSQLLMRQNAAFRIGDSLLVMKTDAYSPPLQLQFAEQQRKEAAANAAKEAAAALKSPLPPPLPSVRMLDAPRQPQAQAQAHPHPHRSTSLHTSNALQVPGAGAGAGGGAGAGSGTSVRFPFDQHKHSSHSHSHSHSHKSNGAEEGEAPTPASAVADEPTDQEGFLFIGDQAGMTACFCLSLCPSVLSLEPGFDVWMVDG
jgi:hypothetical protein